MNDVQQITSLRQPILHSWLLKSVCQHALCRAVKNSKYLVLKENNEPNQCYYFSIVDVDVDVVDLRAQADASMPASNNNVNYTIYSNF